MDFPQDGLKQEIRRFLDADSVMLFARGSTALYTLFERLRLTAGPGDVVIPAICCETVPMAARFAGLRPVFADVSPETACVTPATVERVMSARTRAVVIAHIFGCDARAEEFTPLRSAHSGVIFIEDIAHALGGYGLQRHGTQLDAALLSFAPGKIIPGAAGALAFKSGETVGQLRLDYGDLPPAEPASTLRSLADSLRNFTHGLIELSREYSEKNISGSFLSAVDCYRPMIVHSAPPGGLETAVAGLRNIDTLRQARYGKYVRYRQGIQSERVSVLNLSDGCMCWRCPLLADSRNTAKRLTDMLRSAGVHASNHYFPLDKLFENSSLPVSSSIGARIVNLWVDDDAVPAMIDTAVDIINSLT